MKNTNSSKVCGIGTDIVSLSRIFRIMQGPHAQRFVHKILGRDELFIYQQRGGLHHPRALAFLGSRFAAKEALAKALGLGMRTPVSWRVIQVLNRACGQPYFSLANPLLAYMHAQGLHALVSLSDEKDYACAYVLVQQLENTNLNTKPCLP